MRDAIRPRVSLVIDGTTMAPEGLRGLLDMVEAAATEATVDLSLAVSIDAADEAGEALKSLEDRGHTVSYMHVACAKAVALNTAAARARGDVLLIVETGTEFEPALAQRLADELQVSVLSWMWLPLGGESSDPSFYTDAAALVVRRDHFMRIRGYDERPQMAEVISPDLRVRLGRAGLAGGYPTPRLRIFTAEPSPAVLAESEVQKRISQDASIYRNLTSWSVPQSSRPVLVSVAIATRDRAEFLADSINSVLNQTMDDLEIVVVDDGSTDGTKQVVESFDDPRVRYFYQASRGISAARNLAADVSRGHFTAVHDDDDIMLPDRLEVSLRVLTEDHDASYGSWVNFDNESGAMILHVIRDGFDSDLVAFNGQGPGHSTWLVPTGLIQQTRYDETYTASVDHNLATRLAWAGCRWVHSERVAYLRRMHATQVSAVDGGNQKIGHVLTRFGNEFVASEAGRSEMKAAGAGHKNPTVPGRDDLLAAFGPWLPDHLVTRTAVFRGNVSNKVMKLARYSAVDAVLTDRDLGSRRLLAEIGVVHGITWADMVRLRSRGEMSYSLVVGGVEKSNGSSEPERTGASEMVRHHLESLLSGVGQQENLWLAALGGLAVAEQEALAPAQRRSRVVAASDGARVIVDVFSFNVQSLTPQVSSAIKELVSAGKLVVMDPAPNGEEAAHRTATRLRRF